MINSDDEESPHENTEITAAKEILSWRPGVRPRPLPSKGGPKFFGYDGTSYEIRKVDDQLKQFDNLLKAKKVRKASKLGRAEWMEQYGLAKVTKQGKFIQTMGHHNGEFFALYPEEALFLLDIGDIELTVNDVPVSLQEAFSAILGNNNHQFTLDDYTTFSHLVKRGYIVQRHGMVQKTNKRKRHRSSMEQSSTSLKNPKMDDVKPPETFELESSECVDIGTSSLTSNPKCRKWYIIDTDQQTMTSDLPHSSQSLSNHTPEAVFPNLAIRSQKFFPAPSEELLPIGVPSNSFKICDMWFERIKRDNGKQTAKQHKHYRPLASQKCKNWSEYKAFKLQAQKAEDAKLQELRDKANACKVKPLLIPGSSSVKGALQKLKVLTKVSECQAKSPLITDFHLQYNVYESSSTPFRKTNPGRADFVVIVTNVLTMPPTSLDILSLLKMSKGVPMKFAVVDDGQVSFYEFEKANVPIL